MGHAAKAATCRTNPACVSHHLRHLFNLRIGQRLSLGFGVVIAIFLVMATLAYTGLGSLNAAITSLVGREYQQTVLTNRAKTELADASRGMMSTLLMSSDEQIKKELASIQTLVSSHQRTMAELDKIVTNETSRAHLAAMT